MSSTVALVDLEDVVARFVAEVPIPDEVRQKARILLADAVTLAFAGPGDLATDRTARELAGTGDHLVWRSGQRASPGDAVLLNAIHVLSRFQDDCEMSSWAHPASFVIPTAVAAVEHANGRWNSLLDAVAVGYAITSWAGGQGTVASAAMARGLRPSPVFATLGAAAAATRGLGLDRRGALEALSAASLVSRGTLQSVGTGGADWQFHNSTAARDGLLLAVAAANGMRAGRQALTGTAGFFRVVGGFDSPPPEVLTPPALDSVLGVWHKHVPTLGDNMAAAVAALSLHEDVGADTVEDVEVTINDQFAHFPGTSATAPFYTPTQAQASTRFAVARCLRYGQLDLADYDDRDDPETLNLVARTAVRGDPQLAFTDARIVIRTADKQLVRTTAELPRTLFYRDVDAQLDAAERLLGTPGRRLAQGIIDAPEDAPAADVLHVLTQNVGQHDSERNRT